MLLWDLQLGGRWLVVDGWTLVVDDGRCAILPSLPLLFLPLIDTGIPGSQLGFLPCKFCTFYLPLRLFIALLVVHTYTLVVGGVVRFMDVVYIIIV